MNDDISHLADVHHITHHSTIAYSPWINSTAESVMRSILSATRSMLTELKLAPSDWPTVDSSISSALNSTTLDRLGNHDDFVERTLLRVITVIHPECPILQIIPPGLERIESQKLPLSRINQPININDLQQRFDQLHN